MAAEQWIFIAILGGTLALFISEKLRVDLVAMLALLALAVTGILDPGEALSGFASEPALIVACVFVLSAGLSATGITGRIGDAIGRGAGNREWRAILVIMPATAVLAAFSHHLMVTAMMLPIVLRLARDRELAPSKLLMPMSLAASLGTTLTLMGAPAFLLANNILREAGAPSLDIFSLTPIGIALVAIGTVYMLLAKHWLPARQGSAPEEYLQLDKYYTELLIDEDSPWLEKTLGEFRATFKKRLEVVDWLRHGMRRPNQLNDDRFHAGDVLLVRASAEGLGAVQTEPGLSLHAVAKYGEPESEDTDSQPQLIQAIIAPHSRLIGRSAAEVDFVRTLGTVMVGMWRKEGWLHGELSEMRFQEGDLLVMWGAHVDLTKLAGNRDFLMLIPFEASESQWRRAPVALAVMAATVVAAAAQWLPVHIAFLSGAAAMVLTGCVSIERAYREIDVRIYVMIAGVIPLGVAMDKTGTARLLADVLAAHGQDLPAWVCLLAMFTAAALLTQILSDAATTVLLAPVAIALAQQLGLSAVPFVVCTAMGAVASFLTPIGHHGNLLVLNPGGYRFADFLRVGAPLTVMIGLAVTALSVRMWL